MNNWRDPKHQKSHKTYAATADELDQTSQTITLSPIGVVHSPYQERFATPRQPAYAVQDASARIELHPGSNFEQALQDLEQFSHIWVIYWMHLNQGWNPMVKPPRSPDKKRGVLATRAPHRPNSIGLSVVELASIEGRILHINNHDMLNGTPVLDIKPYIKEADMMPDANDGWLNNIVE